MDFENKEYLEEVFSLIDKTGNGSIDAKDIGYFLRAAGTNPTNEDLRKVIDELGGNDVQISFEQAITQYQGMKSKAFTPDKKKLTDVFKIYDRDGNGCISSAEVIQILSGLGDKMAEDEIQTLINPFQDINGLVNFEDLIDSVLKG